ncbi:MAG: crossover junction endodeoxyribonuclease RuvC [Chloroflexi bacterium]|nr:crossover junction endodeoxyribonuclease RuvC [Chloroflexota bacterium]
MKVLGVDPGTVATGYGVVEERGDAILTLGYGVLTNPARRPIGERLKNIYEQLLDIINQHRPDAVAVEQPFVASNVRAALAIGRAQAMALLAAASRGIPAAEYTPAQVKQRVTNYGGSRKEQIQEMVRLQLGLERAPEPHDAADALAVAICHLREAHLGRLLAGR